MPGGKRFDSSSILSLTRCCRSSAFEPGIWKTASTTLGLVPKKADDEYCSAPSSMRATSRRRTTAPLGGVGADDDVAEFAAGRLSRPAALTCISNGVPAGAGDWPILPAATWTFCSAMAFCTSTAVMPRLASLSGSSQTRIE